VAGSQRTERGLLRLIRSTFSEFSETRPKLTFRSFLSASAARLWAQLAIKWYTIEVGADNDLVLDIERTASDPQGHRAWGLREPLAVGGPLTQGV
jgi:hypothetical protein